MKFKGHENFMHIRKGRGKSKFCYTIRTISELSGRGIWSVRRDIRIGVLDMSDFMKVSEYVKKHKMKNKAKSCTQ